MSRKLTLEVVDVAPQLGAEQLAVLHRAAASPRERVRGGLLVWDWRAVASRYLRRHFPRGWVYGGGRHVALHASPPPQSYWTRTGGLIERSEAGPCLARIIEKGK